jgi:hypothetical protein
MSIRAVYRLIAVIGLLVLAGPAAAEDDRNLSVVPRPPQSTGAQHGAFHVSLGPTTASVLSIGSPIGFSVGTTANGYAHLYVLSASGRVQLWLENVSVKAGRSLSYPTQGVIRATPPGGDEQIVLVVTREPFSGFARGVTRSPLVLQYTHEGFRQALAAKTDRLPRSTWATAELVIRVRDR